MTFSIAARCASTNMFGIAVSSSSPAVAARCAYAQAQVGAVASQNVTDPSLGAKVLEQLALGKSAREAIEAVQHTADHIDYRQITAVDKNGEAFIFSGSQVLGIWSQSSSENVACAGNLLSNQDIPNRMVEAFDTSEGHLADRLIQVMRAAIDAGGEQGPVRSAGMKIVREVPWPIVDLRVDWTESCPIEELAKIWEVYRPQVDDYVTRALNPTMAPSYGVPGDE